MRIYRFDRAVAKPITQHDSQGVAVAPVVWHDGTFRADCMHIAPQGVVGHHPATENQLFLVVSGSGQVRGEEDAWTEIGVGEAAFWEAGERHESRSATGMTAIVIEGKGLDPSRYMPEAG